MGEVLQIDLTLLDDSVLKEIVSKLFPDKKVNLTKLDEEAKKEDPRS